MLNSAICSIDRNLSGATSPGQSGPRRDANKGVLRVFQSSSIAEASQSVCLMLNPGHSLGMSHPSAEMQSLYSTVLADWVSHNGSDGVIPTLQETQLNHQMQFNIIPNTSLFYGSF